MGDGDSLWKNQLAHSLADKLKFPATVLSEMKWQPHFPNFVHLCDVKVKKIIIFSRCTSCFHLFTHQHPHALDWHVNPWWRKQSLQHQLLVTSQETIREHNYHFCSQQPSKHQGCINLDRQALLRADQSKPTSTLPLQSAYSKLAGNNRKLKVTSAIQSRK